MYINRVALYGNLTRDPELKKMPSGTSVASFSIATNRYYKKQDGSKAEQVDYHNIIVFGRQADTLKTYLKKGSAAYIEGRLQTRSWDGEKGKQYRTDVVADRVQFGPRSPKKDIAAEGAIDQRPPSELEEEEGFNPDDIPF